MTADKAAAAGGAATCNERLTQRALLAVFQTAPSINVGTDK